MYQKNKKVMGVGVNDADYIVRKRKMVGNKLKSGWICPFYAVWANMLKRCYSAASLRANPSYIGCHVSEEWKTFSKFKAWMELQEWQGKHLDKDVITPGNKLYSKENCAFISSDLNHFLKGQNKSKDLLPIGVFWSEKDKRYIAACSEPESKVNKRLGYFKCPKQAHEAWRKKKHEHALYYASTVSDQRLVSSLKQRFAP